MTTMRKRANKKKEEPKNSDKWYRNFIIGLMILSTIAVISAFYLPDPANKTMILGTVLLAFVGFWWLKEKQEKNK